MHSTFCALSLSAPLHKVQCEFSQHLPIQVDKDVCGEYLGTGAKITRDVYNPLHNNTHGLAYMMQLHSNTGGKQLLSKQSRTCIPVHVTRAAQDPVFQYQKKKTNHDLFFQQQKPKNMQNLRIARFKKLHTLVSSDARMSSGNTYTLC